MSKSKPHHTPIPAAAQVLAAVRQSIERYVPLNLQGTRLTEAELWQVLTYASVHRTSIEGACTTLDQVGSGNRLREVLHAALPAAPVLLRALNTALRHQLPRVLLQGKRSYALALDCTLIPYHGQSEPDDPEVLRAQAKAGTHHFHGYATVSIVHDRKRYVLALFVVRPGLSMVEIVRPLLDRVRRLGIRVRRVYLDKEFYSVAVFRTLDRRHLAYVLPLPMRKELRDLGKGRRSYYTTYTLRSRTEGAYTLRIALVHRYRRSRRQRRVVRWFGFALRGLPPQMPARQVFQIYRHRFGIETSYRQMNQVRARTSSRNAVLRLLFIGLALLLVNWYVLLRRGFGPPVIIHPVRIRYLTLPRLARWLGRLLEQLLGLRMLPEAQVLDAVS